MQGGLPTFPVRHLYRPGAVERIRVKVWKARRENGPCLSIDIASTKGCRDQEREMENGDSDSSELEREAFHAALLAGFHLDRLLSEASASLSPECSTVTCVCRELIGLLHTFTCVHHSCQVEDDVITSNGRL